MDVSVDSFEFAKRVRKELDKGFGFVPLIGAGMSAPSGIPTSQDIGGYLRQCLAAAMKKPDDRWDPAGGKWPPFCTQDRQGLRPPADGHPPAASPPSVSPIDWNQLAATGEWRWSLEILSRLREAQEWTAKGKKFSISTPQDQVTDSFFLHITRGRRPSTAHIMLAHLADVLGIHTILTTNFDDLIEQAFGSLGKHLVTFDVHQDASLPDPALVLAQRAIVKLHGGRYGLRANASLDEVPSEMDRERFRSYLDGVYGDGAHPTGLRKHLLVMGVSGDDIRTLALVNSAIDHFQRRSAERLQVLWVGYKEEEAKVVLDRFNADRNRGWSNHSAHVLFTVQHDAGVFLLELFQRLCLSLPPGGTNYPAFWRVPPLPHPDVVRHTPTLSLENKKLTKRITRLLQGPADRPHDPSTAGYSRKQPPKVLVVTGKPSVSAVAATAYDTLCRKYNCIWAELDDFCGPSELFVTLMDDVARKAEAPPSPPLLPEVIPRNLRTYLKKYVQGSRREFVVFLNGREKPGSSAGCESVKWNERAEEDFWRFLRTARQPRLLFVVLRRKRVLTPPKSHGFIKPLRLSKTITHDNAKMVRKVLRKITGAGPRRTLRKRFLLAFTLFRHSRHAAALCSWALLKAFKQLRTDHIDNDEERSRVGQRMLLDMAKMGVIRTKPGGFAWMHGDVREALHKELCRQPEMNGYRSACHQGIADWYMKLFRSSDDPLAALESLYHRWQCIQSAEYARPQREASHLKNTAYVEAAVTLRLARNRILSCGHLKSHANVVTQLSELAAKEADKHGLRRRDGSKKQDGHAKPCEPNEKALASEVVGLCEELLRDYAAEVVDFKKAMIHRRRRTTKHHDDTIEVPAREQECRDASYLTGMRCYGDAEIKFRELFRKIDLSELINTTLATRYSVASPGPDVLDKLVDKLRTAGRAWVAKQEPSQKMLQTVIRALRRYIFLQMLLAQADALAGSDIANDCRTSRLKYSEAIYALATDLMRYLEDPGFLQRSNAYLRTQYGVLLANMGRPYEAHRRLNEAAGYASKGIFEPENIAPAVLELRRAEACMCELDQRLGSRRAAGIHHDLRPEIAILDRVHYALERAEGHLMGRRRSVWWWTWLYELQMRQCVYVSRLGLCGSGGVQNAVLTCRQCSGNGEFCRRVLESGSRLNWYDVLRQARLTDLFREFLENSAARRRTPDGRQRGIGPLLKSMKSALACLRDVQKRARKDLNGKKATLYPTIASYAARVTENTREYLQRESRCDGPFLGA
jgi:hypothetical protein